MFGASRGSKCPSKETKERGRGTGGGLAEIQGTKTRKLPLMAFSGDNYAIAPGYRRSLAVGRQDFESSGSCIPGIPPGQVPMLSGGWLIMGRSLSMLDLPRTEYILLPR